MKKSKLLRQGDVLLEPVNSIPGNLKLIKRDKGRVILAYGEVSGHAHAFAEKRVKQFGAPTINVHAPAPSDVTYLEVQEAMAALKHDEHAPIAVPMGLYRVRRQREYTRKAIVRVQD